MHFTTIPEVSGAGSVRQPAAVSFLFPFAKTVLAKISLPFAYCFIKGQAGFLRTLIFLLFCFPEIPPSATSPVLAPGVRAQ